METKTCSKCGTTKPLDDFYKSPGYKDGHHTWCKKCFRKYYNDRYKVEKEDIKARNKAYIKEHPEVKRKIQREHESRNPEQRKAKNKVRWAVESGRMPKPTTLACRICGNRADHYHHWSYLPENWLNVIPLCKHCHGMLHKGSLVSQDVPIPNPLPNTTRD